MNRLNSKEEKLTEMGDRVDAHQNAVQTTLKVCKVSNQSNFGKQVEPGIAGNLVVLHQLAHDFSERSLVEVHVWDADANGRASRLLLAGFKV